MSNKKFDFFGSPQPRAFDVVKYHPEAEDHENLFSTPAVYRQQSPVSIDPFFSCSHRKDRRNLTTEPLFTDPFSPHPLEERPEEAEGIHMRLDYSEEEEEEELLLPITPKKAGRLLSRIDEEEDDPTTRKQALILATPATESRCYQRGLKKLAFQAFRFVTCQRRTTYKEVARKLIKQLQEEHEIESHKGEMNVKRRVYDALNVLIALGLLKRSGSSIIGKKCENQLLSDLSSDQEKFTARLEMSCKKEQLLMEELRMLRDSYQARSDAIREKQKLQREIKTKLTSIKYLSERNKGRLEHGDREDPRRRIEMPFILICRKPTLLKEEADPSKVVVVQQDSDYSLSTSFRSDSSVDIIGDLDLISSMETADSSPKGRERGRKTK